MTSAAALLDAARARLRAGDPEGARRVRLGEIDQPRRVLGVARAPRIRPYAGAWHLGVLLLGDGGLWATNEIVRAREEIPRGFTAENQRRRAELALAARRGGYAEGEEVHVGWASIDVDALDRGEDAPPLLLEGGEPAVRWSATGAPMALGRYLDERVDLLLNPPERA